MNRFSESLLRINDQSSNLSIFLKPLSYMMNINGLHNETSFKTRSNLLKLNENSVNNSKLNKNIIKCGDYVKLTIRRTTVRERGLLV